MLAIKYPTTPNNLLVWRGTTIQLFPPRTQYYCYLVHFDQPFHHAKHYLGSSGDVDQRLADHAAGRGARLMEVIKEHDIGFTLVRLWPCDSYEQMRELERHLKRQKRGPHHCPTCNPHLDPDPACMLRQGHWPFHLFAHQGKRQAMKGAPSCTLNFA